MISELQLASYCAVKKARLLTLPPEGRLESRRYNAAWKKGACYWITPEQNAAP